jgi:hypothetical protein
VRARSLNWKYTIASEIGVSYWFRFAGCSSEGFTTVMPVFVINKEIRL